jgi:hypothetical protein
LGPSISWTIISETTLPPPFSLLKKKKNLDAIDKKIRKEIKNKTRLKKYKLNKKCRS